MNRTIWHDNKFFSIDTDSRTNTPYIRRYSPYDLTDYHWARKVPNMKYAILWAIYSPNGQRIETVQIHKDSIENEEGIIIEKLAEYDNKAKLRPCIDRT